MADKEESSKSRPNKYLEIEGENFVPWSARTKQRLVQEEVWEYVEPTDEGGTAVPANNASAERKKAFKIGNAKALSEIMKYMQDETILDLQEHDNSARDMWAALGTKMILTGEYDMRTARTELGMYKHEYYGNITKTFRDLERLFKTFDRVQPLKEIEKVGYLASALATTGGRWTVLSTNIESDISNRVPDLTYAKKKEHMSREQRDKTARRGAWLSDNGPPRYGDQRPIGGFKKSFGGKGRANKAALQAAIDQGASADVIYELAMQAGVAAAGGGNGNGGAGGGNGPGAKFIPRGRCWKCGETGHRKVDCPHKTTFCAVCKSNDHFFIKGQCTAGDTVEQARFVRRQATSVGGAGGGSGQSMDGSDVDAASIASYVTEHGLNAREASIISGFVSSLDDGKSLKLMHALRTRYASITEIPVDSGCSHTMIPSADKLNNYRNVNGHPGVKIADDSVIPVAGKGDLNMTTITNDGQEYELETKGALHVPNLGEGLASVTNMSDDGCRVTFLENRGQAIVTKPTREESKMKPAGQVVAAADHNGMLWTFKVINGNNGDKSKNHTSHVIRDLKSLSKANMTWNGELVFLVNLELYHRRYGHLGVTRLKRLIIRELTRTYPEGSSILVRKQREVSRAIMEFCEACEIANARKHSAKKKSSGTSRALIDNERGYLDACIVNVEAKTGAICFVVLVDDKSRYGFYKGLKARRDVYEAFIGWQARSEREMDKPMKIVRCDNAPEYTDGRLGNHIRDVGIKQELTSVEASWMNNVAERRIGSIQQLVRASLVGANLGDEYWDWAAEEANELINVLPTSSLPNHDSPYKNRYGKEPDYSMIRIFGCPAYVYNVKQSRDNKMSNRSDKGIHIGRSQQMRGWRVEMDSDGHIEHSIDVTHDESFVTGHSQGRIRRQSSGLVFTQMGGSPMTEAELAPRSSRIVGDTLNNDGPTISRRNVQLISDGDGVQPSEIPLGHNDRRKDAAAVPLAPEPEEQQGVPMQRLEEQRREIDEIIGRHLDSDGETAHPMTRSRSQTIKVRGPTTVGVRHSERPPKPNPKYANTAEALTAKIGDVARTVVSLEKLGMTLPEVAMAAVSMLFKDVGDDMSTVDARPIIDAIAKIANVEPRTLIEIEGYEEGERKAWRAATQAEYDALMRNETWILVPPERGQRGVQCKWVFKAKTGKDGELTKRKARLVAKGFTQRYGTDYDETWAPTMNPVSMRTILGVATAKGMQTYQADVPNAYLKSALEHRVLMKQPEGFVVEGKEDWLCLLLKAIYGLKQAGLEWHRNIKQFFVSNGFKQSGVDNCVFVKIDDDGEWNTVVGIHVDDTMIVTRGDSEAKSMKELLMERYGAEMEDLTYYCGIKIERDIKTKRTFMSQEAYIDKLIDKYDSTSERSVRNPMTDTKLTKEMCPQTDEEKAEMEGVPYSNLVGGLLFAAMMTRAEIAAAVHELSKFMKNPGMDHWRAAIRVLRYLKGTKRHGILFDGMGVGFSHGIRNGDIMTMDSPIYLYCDADYAGDLDDRKSTSGLLVSIAGAAVYWRAKKQGGVTLSTMESEIVSMGIAVQYNEYITALLMDLGIRPQTPSIIKEDNQSAIAYTKNAKNQSKARHIGVRFHYIRENVEDGRIKVEYCPTAEMLADIFTKRLPTDQFEYLRNGIGVVGVPEDMRHSHDNKVVAKIVTISGEWECRDLRSRSVRWDAGIENRVRDA